MAKKLFIAEGFASRLARMLAWWESQTDLVTFRTPRMTPPAARSAIFRWGKLDDNVGEGEIVTVSLWQTTGGGWGGWDEDSDQNVEAYLPPTMRSLPIGCIVSLEQQNGSWIITSPEAVRVRGKIVAPLPGLGGTDKQVYVSSIEAHEGSTIYAFSDTLWMWLPESAAAGAQLVNPEVGHVVFGTFTRGEGDNTTPRWTIDSYIFTKYS